MSLLRKLKKILASENGTLEQLRQRSLDLQKEFAELNGQLPLLNAAASRAEKNPKELATIMRLLCMNYSASALIFAQWADVLELASKFVEKK